MSSKVSIKIEEIRIEGAPVGGFINGLAALKADLEAKGCEVEITIDGEPLDSILTQGALSDLQKKAVKK